MRIFVHEFASGGGLVGKDVPDSLGREGAAMLRALIEDLSSTGEHRVVTTLDARFPLALPEGVEGVILSDGTGEELDGLMTSSDAVWFIAPETGGCLARLVARAEARHAVVMGPSSATIRRASDKYGLARVLGEAGVGYPSTSRVPTGADLDSIQSVADGIGYPLVVKPRRGAGSEGVGLVRDPGLLVGAIERARAAGGGVIVQRFVPGVAASVSLLGNGRETLPLTLNSQVMAASSTFVYSGGTTPFEHPLAERALDVAVRASRAVGGLVGYFGVDVILTDTDVVVIEVNPRLTTAYLGVRVALHTPGRTLAQRAIEAIAGRFPQAVAPGARVRFTSAGQVEVLVESPRDFEGVTRE